MTDYETVKKELNLNDNEIGSHETDLHVMFTEERANYFINKGFKPSYFISKIDGNTWLDVPFYLIDDKINKQKKIKEKVTIYITSEFFGSVQSIEAYLIEHGTRKYAQYDNAPYVKYIPKGKRKTLILQKSYKPYLLIVAGWDNPKPAGLYGEAKKEGNVIIRESQYSSFDDRYKSDFDNIINEYKEKFIADYRT